LWISKNDVSTAPIVHRGTQGDERTEPRIPKTVKNIAHQEEKVDFLLVGQEVVYPQRDENKCNENFGVKKHTRTKTGGMLSFL
jgi:hypothetical protein